MERLRETVPAALGAFVLAAFGQTAGAATFGELSNGSALPMAGSPPYAAGPYSTVPGQVCPPNCIAAPTPIIRGPEGVPPGGPGITPYIPHAAATPRAFLPVDSYAGGPDTQLLLWSYGQINNTTDPYNPWGLSTPYMYVPWTTPFSGWTNATTWNWWRERSGALPRNW
ncbi:hypothetical protein [Tropicimonas sp. IMCC6043]|uniref:hypothetical protein n=1 Tax=Tropicimonas sp. IMCC6043 TaxID=2510645 RepID=UPI00101CC33B|nr:hypothetical protein [Tropicimonas sp. IMCC6043]RYH08674.1 hypothetical protein EU800_15610 [Tropicimonas sp. IMCC6043]